MEAHFLALSGLAIYQPSLVEDNESTDILMGYLHQYKLKLLWHLVEMNDTNPAGKVRHEFGKNCAIDKYFWIHVKIVTWKNHTYWYQLYFLHVYVPINLTILKCPVLVKKIARNTFIFWPMHLSWSLTGLIPRKQKLNFEGIFI